MSNYSAYEGYTDLKYKPKKTDLICDFKITPAKGLSVYESASHVSAESSTGTWTKVSTATDYVWKNRARAYLIKGKNVKIAYPEELFEKGNMPEILSSIAGNVFGMNTIDALRLENIEFTKSLINSFKGPKHGISGVRKRLNVKNRPLVGTIVKPKLGLNTKEHARVAYNAWYGGCDIVKDDENLSSQKFNPFEQRLIHTLEMQDKAEQETGEKKGYLVNVTAETETMIQRMDTVKQYGGKYVMFDVITGGWSALQTLRNNSGKLIVHAHRAMHGALTRNQNHGISMLALAKTYRLIGVDQLHTGTVVGKMEGSKEEVQAINKALTEKMGKIKPTFPVASGGLNPLHVPKLMEYLGKDIIIQMGGGIHGHPLGTVEGATAARDAIDAVINKIPLGKATLESVALSEAMRKWQN